MVEHLTAIYAIYYNVLIITRPELPEGALSKLMYKLLKYGPTISSGHKIQYYTLDTYLHKVR